MSAFDAFRYDGRRAVVVGGASGMGAATAQLARDAGADVVVMDVADAALSGVTSIHADLADKASIDEAVDACGGPVHALFSCAGVADGTPGIERINFIGHRHLIDRMLAADVLPRGSAIGFISSAAGLGWEANLEQLGQFLDTPDFDAAVGWAEKHGAVGYMFTKQAICAYVARRIRTGTLSINGGVYYAPDAPFGGYKQSGIGRENHKMMLEHYQQTKNLLVSYSPKKLGFF